MRKLAADMLIPSSPVPIKAETLIANYPEVLTCTECAHVPHLVDDVDDASAGTHISLHHRCTVHLHSAAVSTNSKRASE